MKNLVTLIIISVIGMYSLAQDRYTGFYGKPNYVEVMSVSYIPLFPNVLADAGYQSNGNSISRGKRWINTGFRIAVGRAFKSNLAAGIEIGIDYNEIYNKLIPYNAEDPSVSDPAGEYSYEFGAHESVSVQHFRFMPKIEFSTFDGLLPSGLVHQIGIGYRRSKIVDKDYIVTYDKGYSNVPDGYEPELRNLINMDQWYQGMQLLYSLRMRTPVGKSLFISYGFRYTLDFRFPTDILTSILGSGSLINSAIAKSQLRNFMSFDFGLTMPF